MFHLLKKLFRSKSDLDILSQSDLNTILSILKLYPVKVTVKNNSTVLFLVNTRLYRIYAKSRIFYLVNGGNSKEFLFLSTLTKELTILLGEL